MTSPRLGVLDFHPIQYHTPLYQCLARRARVEVEVLYLSPRGHLPTVDPDFGVPVAWDIDLLSGYRHHFLARSGRPAGTGPGLWAVHRWLSAQDVVVIHGYSNPWMLAAIAMCRSARIPYLLRGDSQPDGKSTGVRRLLRGAVARTAVTRAAGCLAIGQRNEEFYRRYGARHITFAPYSVDNQRFTATPSASRSEVLTRWGLPVDRPVIIYCGKFYPGKRPLDVTAAAGLLACEVTLLMVGDGILADEVRTALPPGAGVVTGFVNQSELPSYYHAADVLVLPSELENWGLVINEAMAAGVLPVASDRVGAVPDLVAGLGQVYRCGDVADLANALDRALAETKDVSTRERVRHRANRYSLDHTAAGFETAALSASKRRQRSRKRQ